MANKGWWSKKTIEYPEETKLKESANKLQGVIKNNDPYGIQARAAEAEKQGTTLFQQAGVVREPPITPHKAVPKIWRAVEPVFDPIAEAGIGLLGSPKHSLQDLYYFKSGQAGKIIESDGSPETVISRARAAETRGDIKKLFAGEQGLGETAESLRNRFEGRPVSEQIAAGLVYDIFNLPIPGVKALRIASQVPEATKLAVSAAQIKTGKILIGGKSPMSLKFRRSKLAQVGYKLRYGHKFDPDAVIGGGAKLNKKHLEDAGIKLNLPKKLQAVEAKQGDVVLTFESDVDKALWVLGEHRTSKQLTFAEHSAWLQRKFPGQSEAHLRQLGKLLRKEVGAKIQKSKKGSKRNIKISNVAEELLEPMIAAKSKGNKIPITSVKDKDGVVNSGSTLTHGEQDDVIETIGALFSRKQFNKDANTILQRKAAYGAALNDAETAVIELLQLNPNATPDEIRKVISETMQGWNAKPTPMNIAAEIVTLLKQKINQYYLHGPKIDLEGHRNAMKALDDVLSGKPLYTKNWKAPTSRYNNLARAFGEETVINFFGTNTAEDIGKIVIGKNKTLVNAVEEVLQNPEFADDIAYTGINNLEDINPVVANQVHQDIKAADALFDTGSESSQAASRGGINIPKEVPFDPTNARMFDDWQKIAYPDPDDGQYSKYIDRKDDPDVFQIAQMSGMDKNKIKTVLTAAGYTAVDIGNFLRANLASADFSWWRQMFPLIFGNMPEFAKANVKAFRAVWSKQYAKKIMDDIKKDPDYYIYEKIADQHGYDFIRPLDGAEVQSWERTEEFIGMGNERMLPRFTQRLPWIKMSARAHVSGTNVMSWNIFKKHLQNFRKIAENAANDPKAMKKLQDEGFSVDGEAKRLAQFLANLSGRGKIPFGMKDKSSMINAFFFSARLNMGRLASPTHLLPEITIRAAKTDPVTGATTKAITIGEPSRHIRQIAWQNFAAAVGGTSALLLLGEQLGAWEVEWQPNHSDVGKIKIGNVRIDPWGGFVQYYRFFAQLGMGSAISVENEEYQPGLNGTTQMIRSKLSPATGILTDFMTRTTFLGEKLDISDTLTGKEMDYVLEKITPMTLNDGYQTFRNEGVWGIGEGVVDQIGKRAAYILTGGAGAGVYAIPPKGRTRPVAPSGVDQPMPSRSRRSGGSSLPPGLW